MGAYQQSWLNTRKSDKTFGLETGTSSRTAARDERDKRTSTGIRYGIRQKLMVALLQPGTLRRRRLSG